MKPGRKIFYWMFRFSIGAYILLMCEASEVRPLTCNLTSFKDYVDYEKLVSNKWPDINTYFWCVHSVFNVQQNADANFAKLS